MYSTFFSIQLSVKLSFLLSKLLKYKMPRVFPVYINNSLVYVVKHCNMEQVTRSLAAKAFQTSLSLCKETFFSPAMEDHLVLRLVQKKLINLYPSFQCKTAFCNQLIIVFSGMTSIKAQKMKSDNLRKK